MEMICNMSIRYCLFKIVMLQKIRTQVINKDISKKEGQ